jgi:hypothetical protein
MSVPTAVDEVIRMARRLTPTEKAKLVEQLAAEMALARAAQDDQYQRGYEQIPEDPGDAEALLNHLPLSQERWE